MKRISAILLLAITVLAQTELHQVFKLQSFVAHFAEHKAENKDMSLMGFIVLHYFSGNIKDKDYDKDMQLPFKTSECAVSSTISIVPETVFILNTPEFFFSKEYPSLRNSSVRYRQTADIWQPPRLS
ncbi:MAG: hypothetical protein JST86_15320 [Bacteroidetes bacterium]|nr:hypothetical protein [Bacteroidota bacterium]